LTVARLESEKEELLHEIELMKKRGAGQGSPDDAPSTSQQVCLTKVNLRVTLVFSIAQPLSRKMFYETARI